MSRPIELVRDLFANISPRLFDEAIDPLVDAEKGYDFFAKDLVNGQEIPFRPDVVRIVNEDPRRAAQIAANAAEGDGLIARQRVAGAKGGAFGRGSNTVFNNLYDAQAQLGRRYDSNNPVTFYATSPVITGLDGASNFDLVIPQTEEIAQHIAGFNKNNPISPILVSDGTNYRGFFPVNKFNVQNLNPRKVLTNEEQKAKVAETLYAILQHPDIPDAAKAELLQMNGKDIFGAVRNINSKSDLALDFGRLGKFAGALRNDKQFVKSAGGNTWADLTRLQKQMSGAAALDRTFNNQFARLKSDEALAGVAFDYDPNSGSLLQRQFKQPPIVLDGVKLNIDQNVIDAGKLKQQAKSQQYKNVELDNPDSEYGLFIKDVDKLDSGRTTPDTKKILGGGNIIFANERLEPEVAKGLRYQYITSFENSVNQLLKQNAQRQVSGNALDTVQDLGLPEININSPVGTIGYTLEQVVGDDGIAVRNVPRIAMVGYDHNTKQPKLRLGDKDNPIGVGVVGDSATIHFRDDVGFRHPLGDIQRRTNQLGEEVIELPSPLNNLVTGTILEPKPEDLAESDLVFRPGEDKLKALAKLMLVEPKVLDDGNVSYPVIKKRQAKDIDNYLNTEFAADDVQGQLLAKSLNYGSPNFTALKNLGIQPNPSSMAGRGLKVNILDQPSATTILPISWDIKNQTEMLDPTGVAHQMEWDDLYAAQMVKGVDDKGNPIVADSIVLPYNEATGNRKLLGSVERAYERLTGAKPTINYMPAEDGTLIAYIGNKPEQVRYFRNDWDRESLIDTRKVDRAIGRWLGVDDVNLPSEPLMTEKINTQNVDQVMAEVRRRDRDAKQFAKTDQPIEIYKNPEENYGSGLGAYDESTGDMYNVGDPRNVRGANYSTALKLFFDERVRPEDVNAPDIFKTPEFRQRYYDQNNTLVLNTDEVDALQRWVDENNIFRGGEVESYTPFGIILDEARNGGNSVSFGQLPLTYKQYNRDLYPNSPISYDADGKLVKVYHPLWSDGTTEPRYSTVVNSAAIRNNLDPKGNTSYSYNEYLQKTQDELNRIDNELLLLGNQANSERNPETRQALIKQINALRANREAMSGSAAIRQENLVERYNNIDAQEYYRDMIDRNEVPNVITTTSMVDTTPSVERFSIRPRDMTITQTEPVLMNPDGTYSISSQGLPRTESRTYSVAAGDEVTRDYSSAGQSFNVADVSNDLPLLPIDPSLYSTPEGKAQAIRMAKENLRRQRINEARQSIFDARFSGQQLQNIIDAHLAKGISEKETLRRLKNRDYAQYMADLADRQAALKAGPITEDRRIADLNLNNASINMINDELPVDQQIVTSDGITSTNEPAIWRNDDALGWSEQGRLEPAVTPQLIDPEDIPQVNPSLVQLTMPTGIPEGKVSEVQELLRNKQVALRNEAIAKDPEAGTLFRYNRGYVQDGAGNPLLTREEMLNNDAYWYIPEEVDQEFSDLADRIAYSQSTMPVNIVGLNQPDPEYADVVFNPNLTREQYYGTPEVEPVAVSNDQPSPTRATIDKIIALSPQQAVQSTPVQTITETPVVVDTPVPSTNTVPITSVRSNTQPVIEVPAVEVTEQVNTPTQPVIPEQSNTIGGNTQAVADTQNWWNNLSQEQKLMVLGLGGLGAYGLYDAINQPQQQSYAVRAA